MRRVLGCFVVYAIEPLGAVDLDRPGVHVAGGDALGLDPQRELVALVLGPAEQDGVVGGVARDRPAAAVRPLREDVGQHGAHVERRPAGPQRQVEGVHAEVAETAVGAVRLGAALPAHGLAGIEVTRVQEQRAHLDRPAELARGDPAPDRLSAGEEGHLRRAAHELIRMRVHGGHDRLVGGQVDPEGFSPSRCLSASSAATYSSACRWWGTAM